MKLQYLTRQGWTIWHALGAAAMALAAFLLTREAWADILSIAYTDAEQSHIFLVPVVAAWMFWVRRLRLRHCPPTGTCVGPIIVAVGWLSYSIGYNFAIESMWHAGAVAIVLGAALAILGKNLLFRLFPAFCVLAFLVPIPGALRQQVSFPLQTASAAAAQVILETFGVAVERFGNLLTVNDVSVTVAEACNGMRMVFALVLVSYAFAFGLPLRNEVRIAVLIASPIAALVCNVIRLIPTVLFYAYASNDAATTFHDASGWLMVPIAFLLLLGAIRILRWALIPVTRYTLAYQ
jgi:exosortase